MALAVPTYFFNIERRTLCIERRSEENLLN